MATRTYNTISICSGYGGIELGLREVIPVRTVCYVEIEVSVAAVLAARMEEGYLDQAPIWTNLKTFDTEPWRGKVDILTGGFPCQPFSVAGAQLGEDDPRNLWPDTARLIRGLRPPVVFLENVPGILEYYFSTIRPELREMGYEVTEGLFSASETGAPHKRQRIFILADTDSSGSRQDREQTQLWASGSEQSSGTSGVSREGEDGEVEGKGRELDESRYVPLYPPGPGDRDGWAYLLSIVPQAEPTFCRTLNGITSGVDLRLRAIGNGVVPAVAARAFRVLSEKLKKQGNFPEL